MASRRLPWMWWSERGGPLLHGWWSSVAGAVRGRQRRGDTDAERGLVLNLRRDGFGRRRELHKDGCGGRGNPCRGARRGGRGRSSSCRRTKGFGLGRRRPPAPSGARAVQRGPWPAEATCSWRSSCGGARAVAGESGAPSCARREGARGLEAAAGVGDRTTLPSPPQRESCGFSLPRVERRRDVLSRNTESSFFSSLPSINDPLH
jgi:hypothetical protein